MQRGYDEVTVADICEAAGIAPRTFFRYFTGKDDVLAEPQPIPALEEMLDAVQVQPRP